jgi:glucose/arabinose dehydrogenase
VSIKQRKIDSLQSLALCADIVTGTAKRLKLCLRKMLIGKLMFWRNVTVVVFAAFIVACGGSGENPVATSPLPGTTTPTIETRPVFGNLTFNQPVALLQVPGESARWFIVEKGGLIRVFANDQNAMSSEVFLDISSTVDTSGEGGLLGMAFDPDFPLVPEVYLSFTRTGTPLVSYVSRFSSTDSGASLNPASEEVILTVDQPQNNHNGGDIAFGPDGYLYAGFGDGGGGGDPDGNGQNTNTLLGAILRIDVRGGSPYGIPAGNAFESNPVCTGGSGTAPCPEIYAWGLRNPWRFSFDTVTSKLWVGDVGQANWEEIDVIESGGNYGWNIREGAHCFSPANGCADTFIEPITEYDHSLGRSVTGGYVYRGSAISELFGRYVFGDFGSGRIFGISADSATGVTPDILDETGLQIVSFGKGSDGELYVLHFGGTIHQIADAP